MITHDSTVIHPGGDMILGIGKKTQGKYQREIILQCLIQLKRVIRRNVSYGLFCK